MNEKELSDLLSEQQEDELMRFESLPKTIEYVNNECVKCGRVRVELYENGHLICEKCNWNHTIKEYSTQ